MPRAQRYRFSALAALLVLMITIGCGAFDDPKVQHALNILAQEKAKAESIQNALADLLKSPSPKVTEARQLLIARQEDITRTINRVNSDQELLKHDRQRIVDTMATESATLRDQVALLVKAGQISP
jgi:sRNA-binding protein